jgi:hypothetical protein
MLGDLTRLARVCTGLAKKRFEFLERENSADNGEEDSEAAVK